jgi:hypothetical protein
MKILFINFGMHQKNLNALLKYNHEFIIINDLSKLDHINIDDLDYIYSPGIPFPVNNWPHKKFIFGPHFSVFPEKESLDLITYPNAIYIQPSEWAADCWNNILNKLNTKHLQIVDLPFGVDTYR